DDANGCHAVVGARTINGGGPGFAGFTYRSTDARLSFAAGSHGLFVQSATPQCNSGTYHGLAVKQFDRIDLGGFGNPADSAAIISPAQPITSPCPMLTRPARPLCEGGPGPGQAIETIKARFGTLSLTWLCSAWSG